VGRLALAHPPSVRGRLAVPWRRVVATGLGTAAVLALLYLGARETPVFAIRSIELSGGSPAVRAAARKAVQPIAGESLVALDGDALVDELQALPLVRSATYDRAFPSTLRIFVQPEVPLATVRIGQDSWVLSERGRVIAAARPVGAARLPYFRLPGATPPLQPGGFVTDPSALTILRALAVVPKNFPARLEEVGLESNTLTMSLRMTWGDPELRLGKPVDVELKIAVAALVLRSLTSDEQAAVGYLDVSLPERVVVGSNPQPEG
jgi:cell division septal protein FtsQ